MKIVYIMYRVNFKTIPGILGNKAFMLDFCLVWKPSSNSLVVTGQIMVHYTKHVIVLQEVN